MGTVARMLVWACACVTLAGCSRTLESEGKWRRSDGVTTTIVSISPASSERTITTLQQVLLRKGFAIASAEVYDEIYYTDKRRDILVARCEDRGIRMLVVGFSRRIRCQLINADSSEIVYEGNGEFLGRGEGEDFDGAVEAALRALPETGKGGRHLTRLEFRDLVSAAAITHRRGPRNDAPAMALASFTFPRGRPSPDDVAVIVGNSSYSRFSRDIPDVAPARNDAALFRRWAIESLGVPADNVITLEDATAAQLARVFGTDKDHRGQLHDMLRPGRSKVWVYYSGHGAPGARDGSAYLVPVDADPTRLDLSGFPVATLLDNLGKLPATDITLVLEACFSGLSQAGTLVPAASPITLAARAPKVPDRVTLVTAGAADQIASWDQDRTLGLFTRYFLQGMAGAADARPHGDGDGTVAWDELAAYLKDTVTHLARRHYGRDQQVQIVAPTRR